MRLIVFLLTLIPLIGFCDDEIRQNLKLYIEVYDENQHPLEEVEAVFTDENGKIVETLRTNDEGKIYTESVTTWDYYSVVISKEGYVSKMG